MVFVFSFPPSYFRFSACCKPRVLRILESFESILICLFPHPLQDKILANICSNHRMRLANDEEEDDDGESFPSGGHRNVNNPPPPPAPPLPSNFPGDRRGSGEVNEADNDKCNQQPQPPEVPPRQRRKKPVTSPSPSSAAVAAAAVSPAANQHHQFVNGLPPTPKVHMGACFSKVFNECPLRVHCAASWVHPDTHDQHILLGMFARAHSAKLK